jgi:hypothetical protein
MARFMSLTYGVLPSLEDYDRAWQRAEIGEHFTFGNDKRMGSCSLSQWELWDELEKAKDDWENNSETEAESDAAGDWASCVLSVLGIEWI